MNFNHYKNWLRGFIPAVIPAGLRERRPVLDAQKHVTGMITQSDLVVESYRARLEEAA